MYHKSKDLTKDIDIVVNSEDDFNSVTQSLKRAGFTPVLPDHNAYSRLAVSQILTRGEFRIDLFCVAVCGKLSLSEGMMERAKTAGRFGRVSLHVCSVEDILLFKCITDRDGDMDDCMRICLEHIVDWDIVLKEAQEQSRVGQGVWITWITARLEDLEGRGIRIPILRDMCDLSDRFIEEWERGLMARNPEEF